MAAPAQLSVILRRWREKRGISAAVAAKLLGIPLRTYEGVEQGRRFRYAGLLKLAIQTLA